MSGQFVIKKTSSKEPVKYVEDITISYYKFVNNPRDLAMFWKEVQGAAVASAQS